MSIKELYYYLYYKIYKAILYTSEPFGEFMTDFKTSVVIIVLEIWFFASTFNYYNYITHTNALPKSIYISIVIFFSILNYIIFSHNDNWKKYYKEFDKLPKKINRKGSWIVFGIILIIIANLIFSFYLLYADAKRNHTGPYAPEVIARDSLQKAKQIENLKKIYGEDKK